MAEHRTVISATDPYDLSRFVQAQEGDYEQALSEIRSGRKRSHWMWYIFPQFDGLGFSSTSRRYAIKSVAEAEAYLRHPVLGPRLWRVRQAAVGVEGRSAFEVFGSPGRHEAAVVRDPVRLRLARRIGVRPAARPVLPGRA